MAAVNAGIASRSWQMPTAKPGTGMPIATSLRPILNGPSAPTRTSAQHRRMAPIASACPVTASTTGLGNMYIRRPSRAPRPSMSRAPSGPEVITFRSKPAENFPSRPTMTTAETSSASARSRALSSPASTSKPNALALPSSRSMTATPSVTVTVTGPAPSGVVVSSMAAR